MNAKIALVIRAGFISGRMIDQKIRTCPAPSMRAASSSSRGMLRMNWTIRKTKNASVARNLPISSGMNVSTRPSRLNRMYCGMITHVERQQQRADHQRRRRRCGPRNSMRANA